MDNILHARLDTGYSSPHQAFNIKLNKRSSDSTEPDPVIGGYLDDGKLCWLSRGSDLTLIYHGTQKLMCFKRFSQYAEESSIRITICKKYNDLLLVGAEYEDYKGILYLFNPRTSKVIKSIEFPYSITCIEGIIFKGGANIDSKVFSQNLRWLFGVVAVGTEEGHIYLVDLKLDEPSVDNELSKIETVPTVIRDLPNIRSAINRRSCHVTFELMESSHENSNYHYVTNGDEIIETFVSADVSVSSLYFEMRTTSLFVGFSFGQFQIFDLKDLSLTYSTDMEGEGSIIRFAFQEPENDPRKFCYIWIVKLFEEEDIDDTSLTATMFQICYHTKDYIKQLEKTISLYSDLEFCSACYNITLDPSLGITTIPGISNLLQCTSLECYASNKLNSKEETEFCSSPITSLFIVGWETILNNEQTKNLQMVVFDINSWYVAHMPSKYRGYSDDLNYMAIWELDSALPSKKDKILAMVTPQLSLHTFKSKLHPTPLNFILPSSLTLTSHCLLTSETLTFKLPGVQVQVVEYLLENGGDCLVEPSESFEQMCAVGFVDSTTISNLTVDRKREKLLSAALDHGIFSFISKVIIDLSSGDYASSGCTLRMVLRWAWKAVAVIKDSFDKLCGPIFDCSLLVLDNLVHLNLTLYTNQLADLKSVFKLLLRVAVDSTQESITDLETKINVVQIIQEYMKILRWFIGARLLPEQPECLVLDRPTNQFHFIFKQTQLQEIFNNRRLEIKHIKNAPEKSLLMIDSLINEADENVIIKRWQKLSKDKCDLYPPPSLMVLLDMYYIKTVETSLKHSIITYFLLDILALEEASEDEMNDVCYETSRIEHQEIVALFPQTFQLPTSKTKLIKAFWLLDHKSFQASLNIFSEAGTARVTSSIQHRQILQAYSLQGHIDLALKYLITIQPLCSSMDDVKLFIDIYIKNGLSHLALELARSKVDTANCESIYFHLFSCCHQNDELNSMLQVSISRKEDNLVSRFLEKSEIQNSNDILVLYHLKKSRFIDAIKSHKKTRHMSVMGDHDQNKKGKHTTLNRIVQGYMNILPKVQREIALSNDTPVHLNKMIRKEVYEPHPLSSSLNSRKINIPLSHSELLALTLNKTKKQQPIVEMTPFKKNVPSRLDQSKVIFPQDLNVSVTQQSFTKLNQSAIGESPMYRRYSRMSGIQGTSPVIQVNQKQRRKSSVNEMASMLLQTPTIERKRKSSSSRRPNIELMTPQSILKVKLLKSKSPSLPCISQTTTPKKIDFYDTESLSGLDGNTTRILEENSEDSELLVTKWLTLSEYKNSDSKMTPESSRNKALCKTRKSLFAIDTPPVDKLPKNFDSENIKETPKSFTPKRLRFFGLNTSETIIAESQEEKDKQKSSLRSLNDDKVVVVVQADEDMIVDVTGDNTTLFVDVDSKIQQENVDYQKISEQQNIDQQPISELSPIFEEETRKNNSQFSEEILILSSDDESVEGSSDVVVSDDNEEDDDDVMSEESDNDDVINQINDEDDVIIETENDDDVVIIDSGSNQEVLQENIENSEEQNEVQQNINYDVTEASKVTSTNHPIPTEEIALTSGVDTASEEEINLILSDDSEKSFSDSEKEFSGGKKTENLPEDNELNSQDGEVKIQEQQLTITVNPVIKDKLEQENSYFEKTDSTLSIILPAEKVIQTMEASHELQTPEIIEFKETNLASEIDGDVNFYGTDKLDPVSQALYQDYLEPVPEESGGFVIDQAENEIFIQEKKQTVVNEREDEELNRKSEFIHAAQEWDLVVKSHTETLVETEMVTQKIVAENVEIDVEMESESLEIIPQSTSNVVPSSSVSDPTPVASVQPTLIETPTLTRLTREPMFVLSPPRTRNKKKKIKQDEISATSQETKDLPVFIFSPPNIRSKRKRGPEEEEEDVGTPKKNIKLSTFESRAEKLKIPSRSVTGRPPLVLKTPQTTTPSRISTKKQSIKEQKVTDDTDTQQMSVQEVIISKELKETKLSQEDKSEPIAPEPLPRRKTRSSESRDTETPTVTRTSSRGRSTLHSKQIFDHVTTLSDDITPVVDDVMAVDEAKVEEVVVKTPSRTRRTKRIVASSKTSPKHDVITFNEDCHLVMEKHVIVETTEQAATSSVVQPIVTRTLSRTRRTKTPSVTSSETQHSMTSSEEQPTVTRTPSRSKRTPAKTPATASSEAVMSSDDQPTVRRTSSRTKRTPAKNSLSIPSDDQTMMSSEDQPTVTRSSSRSRRTPAKPSLVSISEDPFIVTSSEEPAVVKRTSSRSCRISVKTPLPTSLENEESVTTSQDLPTVTRTSSRTKRTPAKTLPVTSSEDQPTVFRASSRTRKTSTNTSQVTSSDNQPTVTRTSSRTKRTSKKSLVVALEDQPVTSSEDQPTVLRTSSRTRKTFSKLLNVTSSDLREPSSPDKLAEEVLKHQPVLVRSSSRRKHTRSIKIPDDSSDVITDDVTTVTRMSPRRRRTHGGSESIDLETATKNTSSSKRRTRKTKVSVDDVIEENEQKDCRNLENDVINLIKIPVGEEQGQLKTKRKTGKKKSSLEPEVPSLNTRSRDKSVGRPRKSRVKVQKE